MVGPVSNLSYDPGNIKENAYSVVLRHNIKKYLIHEASYDFYIFNQPDIIYKMATFWLIRKSNTWKRVRFTTPLHKLNLETFDTVLLSFSHPYVASGPVKAIVESARYDSAEQLHPLPMSDAGHGRHFGGLPLVLASRSAAIHDLAAAGRRFWDRRPRFGGQRVAARGRHQHGRPGGVRRRNERRFRLSCRLRRPHAFGQQLPGPDGRPRIGLHGCFDHAESPTLI